MRFASLGSGSSGNALVVESGKTRVFIDCGFSFKETEKRLARLGLTSADISAILLTHEHTDHINGVSAFVGKRSVPVYMTHGTHQAINGVSRDWEIALFDSGEDFFVGDIAISPVPVPHDAREPVQFVLSDGAKKLAVLTDLGRVTDHVKAKITGASAMVIECNHDATMLAQSHYPYHLKQRISGGFGHLENAAAGEILRKIDTSKLSHIVAAHLSLHNNCPLKAQNALAQALGCAPEWIGVADQKTGFDWREV